jgi:hypothetical protein
MRRRDTDELAGCDDLGLLPELWEVPLISGDEVVGACGVGAFKEYIVVRIVAMSRGQDGATE